MVFVIQAPIARRAIGRTTNYHSQRTLVGSNDGLDAISAMLAAISMPLYKLGMNPAQLRPPLRRGPGAAQCRVERSDQGASRRLYSSRWPVESSALAGRR